MVTVVAVVVLPLGPPPPIAPTSLEPSHSDADLKPDPPDGVILLLTFCCC